MQFVAKVSHRRFIRILENILFNLLMLMLGCIIIYNAHTTQTAKHYCEHGGLQSILSTTLVRRMCFSSRRIFPQKLLHFYVGKEN